MPRYALASAVWALLPLAAVSLPAQNPAGDLQSHPAKAAAVSYLYPEQVTIAAGKPSAVELHFKVAAGLHINSHSPHTDDLIPTTFKLPEAPGVRLDRATFPAGDDFKFSTNEDDKSAAPEKLSVYTGEFTIHAQLVAAAGEHLVQATLRYQACDHFTCMPPHSIPVVFDVIAR